MASTVTIDDKRWGIIRQFIVEIASGKFELPEFVPEHGDELDGIIQGIVMVAEELKISSVSRAYLDSVITGITDVLLVLDDDFKIVEYNQAALDFFSQVQSELLEVELSDLIDGNNEIIPAIQQIVVANKGKVENVQINLRYLKKVSISFSASVSYISSNNNPRHHVLFIARNVADLIETQRRLEESNTELTTLIYRLSHDIRSPLANIMGLCSLMLDFTDSLDEDNNIVFGSLVAKLTESAKKIDSILHYFNRLSVIQSEMRSEDVSLLELFENLENELRDKFEDVDVVFNMNLDADIVELNCTRLLLTLILLQVFENCFIFRQPGQVLEISVASELSGYDLMLSISDNGIGIDPIIKQDVFNMLVKGHNNKENAGMGLFFVKSALNQMMGKVELQSEVGVGTILTMRIPIPKRTTPVPEKHLS